MNDRFSLAVGAIGLLSLLVAPRLDAQPYLVANINDTESGFRSESDPFVFGVVNDRVIFAGTDLEHGREPWATDGTAAGTRLLADVQPASSPTFGPFRVGEVGELLLCRSADRFFATDGTPEGTVGLHFHKLGQREPYGQEGVYGRLDDPPRLLISFEEFLVGKDLWVTDGTPGGTRLVAELNGSPPAGASLGDAVVFVNNESSELWRSDGTRAGTVPVRSFERIDQLVGLDEGRAIFVADDGTAGMEIWVTDGTPAGTRLVEDLQPGAEGSSVNLLGAARPSGRTFFLLRDPGLSLWSTDGTAAGTVSLIDNAGGSFYPQVGGMLFAAISVADAGVELLASDGTPNGTRILDLCPGSCSSFPGRVTSTSIGLLFAAFDTQHGSEPWLTDGTEAGTRRVADLCPGPCSSIAEFLADLGGRVVLYSTFNRTAWVTDGTAAGTRPLELGPGVAISQPISTAVVDGVAVFGASDDLYGAEPWRTDGTVAGTFRIADLAQGGGDFGSRPAGFEEFEGEAFFVALVGTPASSVGRLWRTDGTAAGTSPVPALDSEGQVTDLLTSSGDLFVLTQHDLRTEMWRTNGSTAGTRRIFADDLPASPSCCEATLASAGGNLYVLGPGLWRAGRTPGSARRLAELEFSDRTLEQGPGILDGRIYFAATAGAAGGEPNIELWSSDGTPAGTRRVRDISPGAASSHPRDFTALGGRLYFIAVHGFDQEGLWRTDGTESGTELLREFERFLGPGRILGAVGGRIVLHDGQTLWATDGTDFAELGGVFGEMGSISSATAVPFAGRLFFIAGLKAFGSDPRLWSTDGTPAGTHPAAGGPPAGHQVFNLFRAGEGLLLLVQHPLFERELWLTDGTPAGRRRIASLQGLEVYDFGLGNGVPPIALGDQLLFNAVGPVIGEELWAVDLDSNLPPFGPPEEPSDLQAEAWSESGVRLSWSDESEFETSFLIAGATAEESLGGAVSVPAGTDSVFIQGLPPETPFTFTVTALNAMGASAPSNEASATPLPADAGPCLADAGTLCLAGGRFAVSVLWRDQHNGGVGTGGALPLAGSDRTGLFWFFHPANVELIAKALDGSTVNGFYWSFYGALSDVEYWVTVVDTDRHRSRTYYNRPGEVCGVGDTTAFPEVAPVAGEASASAAGTDGARDAVVVTWPHTAAAAEARTARREPVAWAPPAPVPPATAGARESGGRWRALSLPASEPPAPQAATGTTGGSCTPGAETLCLLDRRLRVEVEWHDQHNGGSGTGKAVPGTDKSGFFWFFNADNLELVVKALDATSVNGHLWVFYGALSDVEYTITVTDTTTGLSVPYHNPPGEICGDADTGAF